jgi:SAM-dependent methyltransferase
MTDPLKRFSNRVENYVRYRPDYPHSVIEHLSKSCGLYAESVVADIGCGTGISSRLFLENGNRVIGVEPNADMREAAIGCLSGFPGFTALDGRSAATTLAADSIDFVISAQAFHWFEPRATRREFERILKPGGWVILMWNERQLDSTPFHVEYEAFLIDHAGDYERVRHENITDEQLHAFFGGSYKKAVFANHQDLDLDGLRGRILSSSYMPTADEPGFGSLENDLRSLFAKHSENGRIRILYDTSIYYSQF